METTKKCRTCGEVKVVDDFAFTIKNNKKYLKPDCNKCNNKRTAIRRRDKREATRDKTVFISTTHKLCCGCKAYKPFEEFSSDGKNKLKPICRVCQKERHDKSVAKKLAKIEAGLEVIVKYPTYICSDCGIEKHNSEFYFKKTGTRDSKCRPCKNKYGREIYHKNFPEKREEWNEKRKAKYDPVKASESNKKYRAKHPEKEKKRAKRYVEENRASVNARARNRKARKRNAVGKHTSEDEAALMVEQEGKCKYCDYVFQIKPNNRYDYHIDHIFALKAEDGITANFKENLQLLCQPCNDKKNNHDPIQYEFNLGILTDERFCHLVGLKLHIMAKMIEADKFLDRKKAA